MPTRTPPSNPPVDPLMLLPRHLPKGVKLVYEPAPPGGFVTGRNPYPKGTTEWRAFDLCREGNWIPWLWHFKTPEAYMLFMAEKAGVTLDRPTMGGGRHMIKPLHPNCTNTRNAPFGASGQGCYPWWGHTRKLGFSSGTVKKFQSVLP